jgi:hypothetical protein
MDKELESKLIQDEKQAKEARKDFLRRQMHEFTS